MFRIMLNNKFKGCNHSVLLLSEGPCFKNQGLILYKQHGVLHDKKNNH